MLKAAHKLRIVNNAQKVGGITIAINVFKDTQLILSYLEMIYVSLYYLVQLVLQFLTVNNAIKIAELTPVLLAIKDILPKVATAFAHTSQTVSLAAKEQQDITVTNANSVILEKCKSEMISANLTQKKELGKINDFIISFSNILLYNFIYFLKFINLNAFKHKFFILICKFYKKIIIKWM